MWDLVYFILIIARHFWSVQNYEHSSSVEYSGDFGNSAWFGFFRAVGYFGNVIGSYFCCKYLVLLIFYRVVKSRDFGT